MLTVIIPQYNKNRNPVISELRFLFGGEGEFKPLPQNNSAVQSSVSAVQKGLVGRSVAASFGATGVGAVVGLAVGAIQKVLDIAVKAEAIANKIEAESTAINVTKMRAGIAYNRSRAK